MIRNEVCERVEKKLVCVEGKVKKISCKSCMWKTCKFHWLIYDSNYVVHNDIDNLAPVH